MMWGDGMARGMSWAWVFWPLLIVGAIMLVVALVKTSHRQF